MVTPSTNQTRGSPRPLRLYASIWVLAGLFLLSALVHVLADGGSTSNPDLQVGGFTVFGTNTTGATAVTSGWGNVYIDGSLQVQSNLHVNANLQVDAKLVSTNEVAVNKLSITHRDQILNEGATIDPAGSYIRIRGNTEPVNLGDPQIGPGSPGQLITLQGVSTPQRVTLVNGAGLRTNREIAFTLGAFDTIQFIYDESTSTWVEINRSNNRWEH